MKMKLKIRFAMLIQTNVWQTNVGETRKKENVWAVGNLKRESDKLKNFSFAKIFVHFHRIQQPLQLLLVLCVV